MYTRDDRTRRSVWLVQLKQVHVAVGLYTDIQLPKPNQLFWPRVYQTSRKSTHNSPSILLTNRQTALKTESNHFSSIVIHRCTRRRVLLNGVKCKDIIPGPHPHSCIKQHPQISSVRHWAVVKD